MSDEVYSYGDIFPLEDTICLNCAFRMSRVIVPLDPDSFGITDEDIRDMDLEDEEDIMVEQHTCLVIQQDMDYVVRECNHYKDINEKAFFMHNPY